MKAIILFILFFFPLITFGQDKSLTQLSADQKNHVIKVVSTWVEELFLAEDIDKLMQISDIPFAFDRVKVLASAQELQNMYLSIFENKGQREVPRYEIHLLTYKSEIIEDYIPLNVVKVGVLIFDDEGDYEAALVGVLLKQDEYKVIGFSD